MFVGALYWNLIMSSYYFVAHFLLLRLLAEWKFKDKTWATPLKISAMSAVVGFIFGLVLQRFPSPLMIVDLWRTKDAGLFVALFPVLHLFFFSWLVRTRYHASWKPALLIVLALFAATTFIGALLAGLIFTLGFLFAFSGGFNLF
jgi:hypothetical protein